MTSRSEQVSEESVSSQRAEELEKLELTRRGLAISIAGSAFGGIVGYLGLERFYNETFNNDFLRVEKSPETALVERFRELDRHVQRYSAVPVIPGEVEIGFSLRGEYPPEFRTFPNADDWNIDKHSSSAGIDRVENKRYQFETITLENPILVNGEDGKWLLTNSKEGAVYFPLEEKAEGYSIGVRQGNGQWQEFRRRDALPRRRALVTEFPTNFDNATFQGNGYYLNTSEQERVALFRPEYLDTHPELIEQAFEESAFVPIGESRSG